MFVFICACPCVLVIDKSNLSELLLLRGKPTPENETAELAYAAFKSVLLALPDAYNATSVNNNKTKNNSQIYLDHFPELFKSFLNGRVSWFLRFLNYTQTRNCTKIQNQNKEYRHYENKKHANRIIHRLNR